MGYNPWSCKESDMTELMLLIHCLTGFLTLTPPTKVSQAPIVCLGPKQVSEHTLSKLCLGL